MQVSDETVATPLSTDETSSNEPTRLESNAIESSSASPNDVQTNGTPTENTNDDTPALLKSPIKLEPLVDHIQSIPENGSSSENLSEYFYEFKAENFQAEQVS